MDFFTADTHWFHSNIIKHDGRPFKDIDEMHSVMIERWNKKVKKTDHVYIVGDFTMIQDEEKIKSICKKLNGKLYLITGNHDYFSKRLWAKECFQIITPYLELKRDGNLFVLCHFPFETWNRKHYGSYHLHGHTHSHDESRKTNRLNVGCMLHDFAPISIEEVTELIIKNRTSES